MISISLGRSRQIIATIRSNRNRILLIIVFVIMIDTCLRFFVIFDDRYFMDDIAGVSDYGWNKLTISQDFPFDDEDENGNRNRTITTTTTTNNSYFDTNSKTLSDYCSRKTLLHLWTKNPNPKRSLFPKCSVFFRAISARNPLLGNKKDENETLRILGTAVNWTVPEPHDDKSVLKMMFDDENGGGGCEEFRRRADFAGEPASKEEAEFPLAYVFVPFRNAAQTVRLFRMIYQPQNAYCLTYDTKNRASMNEVIRRLASCFPENVVVNPNPEPIHYSTYSLLRSVMSCMDVLRNGNVTQKWRYVQVVSCNDFPLKTNAEMVQIFKALNGSQDSELAENYSPQFLAYKHGPEDDVMSYRPTDPRSIPPGGLTFYKGSFATSMSREFVDFLFTDPVSRRFFRYLDGSQFPDEIYWSSLVHNIQLNPPGGFPGQCLSFYEAAEKRKPYISRFQIWGWSATVKCRGKIQRSSCVYGIRDLSTLLSEERMELFAHKLYEQFEPALLYCLEVNYWNQVCARKNTGLDMEYYKNLPSVIYHNLPEKEKEKYVCNK